MIEYIEDEEIMSLKPGDILRKDDELYSFYKFERFRKNIVPDRIDIFEEDGTWINVLAISMDAIVIPVKELCKECLIQPVCDKPHHSIPCYRERIKNETI